MSEKAFFKGRQIYNQAEDSKDQESSGPFDIGYGDLHIEDFIRGRGYNIFREQKSSMNGQNHSQRKTEPISKFVQGKREQRLLQEFQAISYHFQVHHDDANYSYLIINRVPLKQGFSQSSTSVLVAIPDDYPPVLPEHFFVKKSLMFLGRCPAHLHKDDEFNELSPKGWAKFELYLNNKTWEPWHIGFECDSLIAYLALIRTVLSSLI